MCGGGARVDVSEVGGLFSPNSQRESCNESELRAAVSAAPRISTAICGLAARLRLTCWGRRVVHEADASRRNFRDHQSESTIRCDKGGGRWHPKIRWQE